MNFSGRVAFKQKRASILTVPVSEAELRQVTNQVVTLKLI